MFDDPQTGRQVTTGTPIALLIENTDQRSKDYDAIKDVYRPGHADYVYDAKYGVRDYRGGGRSSARETATRVAAGAVARKIIPGVEIRGALVQMGPHKIDRANWDWDECAKTRSFAPTPRPRRFFEAYLDGIRKAGSSIGAVIEIVAENAPPGWGAPVYGKLDADLAGALMSINAVKGVEIGDGFASAGLSGEANADEMRGGNAGAPFFLRTMPAACWAASRRGSRSSRASRSSPPRRFCSRAARSTAAGAETEIVTEGRHDPCVGIRAVPVGEAMVACVLADHFLRHRGQVGAGARLNSPASNP